MYKTDKKPRTLLEALGGDTSKLDSLILSLNYGEGLRLTNAGAIARFQIQPIVRMPKGGNYAIKRH